MDSRGEKKFFNRHLKNQLKKQIDVITGPILTNGEGDYYHNPKNIREFIEDIPHNVTHFFYEEAKDLFYGIEKEFFSD